MPLEASATVRPPASVLRVLHPPVGLALVALALHGSGLDTASLEHLRDPVSGRFVVEHSWYFEFVLRIGGTTALACAGLALLVYALAGPRHVRPCCVYLFACLALTSALALGVSKVSEFIAADLHAGPDTLAAAGFAWVALACIAYGTTSLPWGWWLLPGLALGSILGLTQVARGVHPPSSEFWSLALAWLVAGLTYAFFRARGWLDGCELGSEDGEVLLGGGRRADRALPWVAATGAGLAGVLFFSVDLLLDAFRHRYLAAEHVFEGLELGVMGIGLGAAAYYMAEHLRDARARARAHIEAEREERLSVLGRVAASVAHEVRNPLHTARLIVDEQRLEIPALGTHALRAELDGCLERIDQAVDLVYRLARPELDEGGLADLVDVAHESIARVERASGSGARFRWLEPPPARAPVRGSPRALAMVVDNLLRNADSASAQADPVALILAPGRGTWSLRITNAGHLGERAQQASTGRGLGLGLAISRQLAANAGATIDLSEAHERVTCILTWPAQDGAGR